MGTGYGDAGGASHATAESLGVEKCGDASRLGEGDLRMIGLDRGGGDDQVAGVWQGIGSLLEVDEYALSGECSGGGRRSHVRALNLAATSEKHSREAGHATATDTDEIGMLAN